MPWSDQPITQVIDRYQSAWCAHRVDAAGNYEQVLTLLKHHLIACISSQKSNSTTELPNRSPPSRRVPTTPLEPPVRVPAPARSVQSAISSPTSSPASEPSRLRASPSSTPIRLRALTPKPPRGYVSPPLVANLDVVHNPLVAGSLREDPC